jgi:ABC-type Fe3+-hydroxamate transport system substrate-binding protein
MMSHLVLILLFCLPAKAEPKRIITLNPSLTEIVYALKKDTLLVGTIESSDYPEAAKELIRVGSYGKPNIEKIIELKPDVVITFSEGIDQITPQLKRAKIKLLALKGSSLTDFPKIIETLSEELDAKEQSQKLLKDWNEQWAQLKKAKKPASLLLQLELTPLIVAGHGNFLSEILDRCGYKNAFKNKKGYPTISWEALHGKKIDLVVAMMEDMSRAKLKDIKEKWSSLPPFKNTQVLFYNPHTISRLGPRLPLEAKDFCESVATLL